MVQVLEKMGGGVRRGCNKIGEGKEGVGDGQILQRKQDWGNMMGQK